MLLQYLMKYIVGQPYFRPTVDQEILSLVLKIFMGPPMSLGTSQVLLLTYWWMLVVSVALDSPYTWYGPLS